MTSSRARFFVDFALFGAVAALCAQAGFVLMNNLLQGNADMEGASRFVGAAALTGVVLARPARWWLMRAPSSLPVHIATGAVFGALWGALLLLPIGGSIAWALPYTTGAGAALASAVCPIYVAALGCRGRRRAITAVLVHAMVALAAFGSAGLLLLWIALG